MSPTTFADGSDRMRGGWRGRALLVMGAIAAALGIVELCLRAAGIELDIGHDWKFDRQIGWHDTPNARYVSEIRGRLVAVEINARGFRDVDHRLEKPPGKKRIVVIGDSFAEATQVNLYETFFRRLQDRLGDGWEVINLGIGDFGSANEYLALAEIGLAYSPDVVIQEIFPLNDICNNGIELFDECGSNNDRYRPYFVEKDGTLDLTSVQPLRNFLRRHSAAYGVLERVLDPRRGPDRYLQWVRFTAAGMKVQPTLGAYTIDAAQPPMLARAWHTSEAIFQKTAALCKAKGIAYLPMIFPFERELTHWTDISAPFPTLTLDKDYPRRRLTEMFARLGIRSLALAPELLAHLDEVLPFLDGHLNAAGHRVAAEAIFRELHALGLVEERDRRDHE